MHPLRSSPTIALRRAVGLGLGCSKHQVDVSFMGGSVAASLYYAAAALGSMLKPYSWPKELIVASAPQHGLPREHIRTRGGAIAIGNAGLAGLPQNIAFLSAAAETL